MTEDRDTAPRHAPDASNVVQGSVGSARLTDPAAPGASGVDLDALQPIDSDPGAHGESGSIDGGPPDERQDRDHVGVDWDLTRRDRG